MDHRVSKDMISSGMTPSGEKSQADLGKSQYGSAPSPNRLMDAYHSMYQNQKQENLDEGKIPAGLQAYLDKKKGKKGKDDEDNGDEKKGKKGKKSKGGKPDFLDLDKDGDKKEPMKKASKEKKESVDLLAAYYAVYEHHKKDEDGNTIPHDDNVEEGVMTVAGGAYGAKKDGVKGAIVGGTAGAMLDSMNKPKKVKVKVRTTEEVQQVDEVLGLAAGALGAMKGIAAGKAAGALAGKAAMKTAVKSGLTKTAAGKTAAKMGAKAAALKTGVPAAVSKGAMGALNYGTAGSIAGSTIGAGVNAVKNVISTPITKKQNTTGTVSAGVDLFDIVQGKLLDEGLNEKEVIEIMTSLTLEEINEVIQINEISADLLKRAAKGAEAARGKAAVAGNRELAKKKLAQSAKFSDAMKQKNLATSRAENMRKPTGPMASRPQPDPTKPYPGTPR